MPCFFSFFSLHHLHQCKLNGLTVDHQIYNWTLNWLDLFILYSLQDVIVRLGFISTLMMVFFPLLDPIDDFLLHSSLSPAVCILIPLLLCIFYPPSERWNSARGDTTIIMASNTGVALGHWICYQYGYMQKASTLPPYNIIPPTFNWAGLVVLRTDGHRSFCSFDVTSGGQVRVFPAGLLLLRDEPQGPKCTPEADRRVALQIRDVQCDLGQHGLLGTDHISLFGHRTRNIFHWNLKNLLFLLSRDIALYRIVLLTAKFSQVLK